MPSHTGDKRIAEAPMRRFLEVTAMRFRIITLGTAIILGLAIGFGLGQDTTETKDTTAVEDTSAVKDTTAAKDTNLVQDTTRKDSDVVKDTTTKPSTASAKDTTSQPDTAAVRDTTAVEDTTKVSDTTSVRDTSQVEDTTEATQPLPSIVPKRDTTAPEPQIGEIPADTGAVDTAVAEEAEPEEKQPEHAYVGAKKCRICHKDEFTSWMVTAHARTFERLSLTEKQDPDCIGCHTTGVTPGQVLLEGVQCEACHGPGNDYRKTSIMKDKELAMEKGLIEPTAEVCERCHNEDSPTFIGFDYETFVSRTEEIHIIEGDTAKVEGEEE
jgi:hypothetical protein